MLFPVRHIHASAWWLIILSAVLQVLIFPLPGLYVLCWFALTPLILALLRTRPASQLQIDGVLRLRPASPGQGFVLGYVCGILFYGGTCYWIFDTMRLYGGLSPAMAALVLVLFCCYLGLYHGLFGLLVSLLAKRRDFRRPLVMAPFLWVAVELARTRFTAFPWNLLGIAQVDNAPLCRISAWTGVYGISFEIALVNVALAAAFLVPKERRGAMLAAALAAAAVLQAGRLIEAPKTPSDHKALLVQQNVPVAANWTPSYFQQTLTDLVAMTENSVASPNAGKIDLIVWPESPAPFFTNDARFRDALSDMARKTNTWVIAGAVGVAGERQNSIIFNSAALISPGGNWTARYDKVHLVPFGEYLPFPSIFAFAGGLTKEVGEFTHGASRMPLDAQGERLGVFICYESVFPDEVRQFADQGADVLVNISNDGWYGDSGAWAQHLNQTRMRAIENSRWLLSATDTGLTAAIDPWGRIVARAPRKERTTLLAPYALNSATTFYSRHGDWFAYACAIISLGALIARFTSRFSSESRHKADVQA
ncbi:MAG TPA: apolipoprotein N-acyltransferase [Verrucomicrobiae bacterium]|jgi:apolipoprotein N-acyltransferase|nr:apolipoprotein N-acyltransferase [Verrucomicrobiae bacterium]